MPLCFFCCMNVLKFIFHKFGGAGEKREERHKVSIFGLNVSKMLACFPR